MGPGGVDWTQQRATSPLMILQLYRMKLINQELLWKLISTPTVFDEDEFTTFIKNTKAEFGRDLWDPED